MGFDRNDLLSAELHQANRRVDILTKRLGLAQNVAGTQGAIVAAMLLRVGLEDLVFLREELEKAVQGHALGLEEVSVRPPGGDENGSLDAPALRVTMRAR